MVKKDNKENRNSARAERKRKHSPARSTGRSITPVPESRLIVIKPKNRIAAPANKVGTHVSNLEPPTFKMMRDFWHSAMVFNCNMCLGVGS
jgi:hypothetical protein